MYIHLYVLNIAGCACWSDSITLMLSKQFCCLDGGCWLNTRDNRHLCTASTKRQRLSRHLAVYQDGSHRSVRASQGAMGLVPAHVGSRAIKEALVIWM